MKDFLQWLNEMGTDAIITPKDCRKDAPYQVFGAICDQLKKRKPKKKKKKKK